MVLFHLIEVRIRPMGRNIADFALLTELYGNRMALVLKQPFMYGETFDVRLSNHAILFCTLKIESNRK